MATIDRRIRLLQLWSAAGAGPFTQTGSWLGCPEAEDLRTLLRCREYYRLANRLADRRRQSPGDYSVLLAALHDWRGRPRFLDGWVWYASHLCEPWLVRGAWHLQRAFQARPSGSEASAGILSLQTFYHHLDHAAKDLATAAARAADNPEPLAYQLLVDAADGGRFERVQRTFEALNRRARHHYKGHANYLLALCRLSSEREQEVITFIDRTTAELENGSLLWALVPQGLIEGWAQRRYTAGVATARHELMASPLKARLWAAFERLFGSRRRPRSALVPQAAGHFAVAFYLAGDGAGTQQALAYVDQPAGYPWSLLRTQLMDFVDPERVLRRVRAFRPEAPDRAGARPRR